MDIICIDVNGLHFVLQDWNACDGRYRDNRISKLFAEAPIKLINNFNNRQAVCIAPKYLFI